MNCWSCGAELEIPDKSKWDIVTKVIDGTEMIVGRHVAVTCPQCGSMGHPSIPHGSEIAAAESRFSMTKYMPEAAEGEVANIIREDVDPPEPMSS